MKPRDEIGPLDEALGRLSGDEPVALRIQMRVWTLRQEVFGAEPRRSQVEGIHIGDAEALEELARLHDVRMAC